MKLGKRLAKHLLRRATFGINKSLINEFSDYTVDQALTKLLEIPNKKLIQPIHYVKGGLTSPSPWINDDPVYGPVNDNNDSVAMWCKRVMTKLVEFKTLKISVVTPAFHQFKKFN